MVDDLELHDLADPNPEGEGGEEPALEDIDLADAEGVDVEGGLLLFSKQGITRSTPKIKYGATPPRASSALAKIAEEKQKGPAKAKVIVSCTWLGEKDGKTRSVSEAQEKDALKLEVRVNQTPAPDGTAAKLTIFRHLKDKPDEEIASLDGQVKQGVVLVDWTCDPKLDIPEGVDPIAFEPTLTFKVECGGEDARSPILAVGSFLDFTALDKDGNPVEMDYAVTLPQGRRRSGKTGPDGHLRLRVPPGRGQVKLGERETGFLDFTCVDEATGKALQVRYRLVLADGSERAGETGPDGKLRLEDVPAGDCDLVIEEVIEPAAAPAL